MIYKVIHAKDGVETVYVTTADSSRAAITAVIDSLYDDRTHPLHWTPEEKATDYFGLMLPTGEYTNRAMSKKHGFLISAVAWEPDVYRLYAFDTKTGAMT